MTDRTDAAEVGTMATLDLEGPWDFTPETINTVVTQTSAGNYALGYLNEHGIFIVKYVGRSDDDLHDGLHGWVGTPGYTYFKASYAPTAEAAFEKQCRNYHDFGESLKLDNGCHPEAPLGSPWRCPVCDIFD
jgi:hypothetical protein